MRQVGGQHAARQECGSSGRPCTRWWGPAGSGRRQQPSLLQCSPTAQQRLASAPGHVTVSQHKARQLKSTTQQPTSLISPNGRKAACSAASFTVLSRPPTYSAVLGLDPLPALATSVVCKSSRAAVGWEAQGAAAAGRRRRRPAGQWMGGRTRTSRCAAEASKTVATRQMAQGGLSKRAASGVQARGPRRASCLLHHNKRSCHSIQQPRKAVLIHFAGLTSLRRE